MPLIIFLVFVCVFVKTDVDPNVKVLSFLLTETVGSTVKARNLLFLPSDFCPAVPKISLIGS